jgi:hypothetical protein
MAMAARSSTGSFGCRLDPGNIGAGRRSFVPRHAQQAGQGLPSMGQHPA